MAVRNTRRRLRGVVPWVLRGAWAAGRWMWRHPQPVFIGAMGSLAAWALWSYAQQANLFRVAHVQAPADIALELPDTVIGQNVWRVDLAALSAQLSRRYPAFQQLRVIRQLPDTIRIDAMPRLPIAQVRLNQWHPIDGEGFIFPEVSAESSDRLIQLTVSDRDRVGSLKAGQVNRDERVQLGLRVLAQLRRVPGVISRRLMAINVAEPRQIRFVVELPAAPFADRAGGTTEIRCGSEAELTVQLERLQRTLRVLSKQPAAVEYIDVRFAEPVVGPRT